ncbi:L-threonylcarbamoyladenylate synthase [Aestuariimicrobium ganziense]|uniref:L-threonylcarbamoyladenylate synthase n=1 Tax=Aestuariimicrobium ganziense TaxID=2773677 RepID=UPI00194309AD|nr:L-threonylcarbamoyladenylate synthase [Aestuariimicrobium ganziense]
MARHLDVHPVNPQPRALRAVVTTLEDGGLVALPTDSGYALVCSMGNKEGLERIRSIRHLDQHHHFTLLVSEFGQVGQWVEMDNWVFRAVKAATPGPYTFILKATREVPRVMQHPRKKTIGIRVPDHVTTLAVLDAVGAPLMSSTLIMPDQDVPLSQGWVVADELEHLVDVVVDSGDCGIDPTTVVDLSSGEPEVLRVGAGDPEPFEA